MIGASREGLYNKNLKAKPLYKQEEKKTDWVNILLFALLIATLLMFLIIE